MWIEDEMARLSSSFVSPHSTLPNYNCILHKWAKLQADTQAHFLENLLGLSMSIFGLLARI